MKAARLRKLWLRAHEDAARRPEPSTVKQGPVIRGENARRLREIQTRTREQIRRDAHHRTPLRTGPWLRQPE